MPFFYFDIVNEEDIADDQGFELASLDAAKQEAVGYLLESSRTHLTSDRPRQQITCTVKDRDKRPVIKLRLILEIDKV